MRVVSAAFNGSMRVSFLKCSTYFLPETFYRTMIIMITMSYKNSTKSCPLIAYQCRQNGTVIAYQCRRDGAVITNQCKQDGAVLSSRDYALCPARKKAFFIPYDIYSRSSRKRTPSERDKNVCNWSWPLTRMVLVSGH